MNRFIKSGLQLFQVCLILIGILFVSTLRADYTGSGVPLDASTGLPAAAYPTVENGDVFCVIPDGSGGWFIGGSFTTVGGVARTAVAKINSDGTLDAGWHANVNSGGVVYALAIGDTDDSKLYIGGSFTQVDGTDRNNIARVTVVDGSLDTWYLANGATGTVYALATNNLDYVILGGDFTYTVGANNYSYLVMINNEGTSTGPINGSDTPVNNTVRTLVLNEANDNLVVGGDFTGLYDFGTLRDYERIFRMSWMDAGWYVGYYYDTGLKVFCDGPVRAVALVDNSGSDPRILVGGDFSSIGGEERNRLAMLEWGGFTPVTSWNPNITGGSASVNSLSLRDFSADTVYVGGDFGNVGASVRNNLAAIDITSGLATDWDPNPDGAVRAISAGAGYVYVGGEFQNMGEGGGGGEEPTASELLFAADNRLLMDNSSFTDTLRLVYNGTQELNGLQFRLRSNPTDAGADTVLTLTGAEKGSDIAGAEWNFFFELKEDAGGDYMIVLIYGQDSTSLPSGTYNDLVRFTYDTGDVLGVDTLRSYFRLEEVYSSLINGDSAGVIGDNDQVVDVYGVQTLGDVNMDGAVDIADLLLIRDFILERVTFDAGEFERADVAPWVAGNPSPSPDGKVNVQDLSLLQNIILTGQYPSDAVLAPPSIDLFAKITTQISDAITDVNIQVSADGITIRTNSEENIIGMQIELDGITSLSPDFNLDSKLGNAFYYHNPSLFRALFYDQSGKIELASGENLIANISTSVTELNNVQVKNIVIVNGNLEKIKNINVKIDVVTSTENELPIDYDLSQNYPNPFNPSTTIQFSLKYSGNLTLKVYNMLGQEVKTLYSGQMESGRHSITWDGTNNSGMQLSSGTYIYKITSGEFVQSKKMLLLK